MPTKRILIIESEEEFAQSLATAFMRYDTEVEVILDGKEGLQRAKSDPPDMVLLRVELPRMSGYSICKKLKSDKKLKSVALIIMSSEATDETFDQHRKLKTRADEYIIKPFDNEKLLEKARLLIELEELDVPEVEAFISLDEPLEDESASLADEESFSFEDIGDLDGVDEEIDLDDDASTVIMNSPLEDAEALDHFDEAFDGLQVKEEDQEGVESRPAVEVQTAGEPVEELTDLDDVLESLEEIQKEEAGGGGEVDVEEDELDLSMIEDLSLTEDEEAKSLEGVVSAVDDEVFDENLLEGLEMKESGENDLPAPSPAAAIEGPSVNEIEADAAFSALRIDAAEPVDELVSEVRPDQLEEIGQAEPAVVQSPGDVAAQFEVVSTERSVAEPGVTAASDPVLLTRLQNAEEENRLLREKVAKLEARIEEIHQTTEKRESELGSLRNRSTSKEKEFLSLKSAINAKDREILEYKEEINAKEQEILQVQEAMAEREAEIGKLQEAVAGRDRDLKEQADRFDELLRVKNELEEKHAAGMAEWEERYIRETAELEHKVQMMTEQQQQSLAEAQQQVEEARRETQQVKTELVEANQRHNDEVYGLRARSKAEIDSFEQNILELTTELENIRQRYEQERAEHEGTREEASKVPELQKELEQALASIGELNERVSGLQTSLNEREERMVQAYQRIKNDEKLKDKARKAVEIAFTLLADEVSGEGEIAGEADMESGDEAHT